MAVIDRLILRLAVYQLQHVPDVPPNVVISEAVELARRFGGDESGRFVNGVLDAIKKKLARQKPDGPEARIVDRCMPADDLPDMPQEHELLAQRRANMEALARLGVDLYPHEFERTDTIAQLVAAPRREAQGRRSRRRASRRRRAAASSPSAASARRTSWCSPTAARASRSTSGRTRCGERDFQVFKLLDLGDFVGVRGHLFRTKTNEFTIWASQPDVPRQVPGPAAREVARPAGHRDPLPPALPRPDRQPRHAPGLRGAQPRRWPRSASS